MKYKISINQKAYKEIAPSLILSDAAVMDFLRDMCVSVSKKLQRIEINGDTYTWVSYSYLKEEMPMLHITSIEGIRLIIQKLEKEKLIKTSLDPKLKRKYVALTTKVDLLYFEKPLGTDQEKEDSSSSTLDDPDLSSSTLDRSSSTLDDSSSSTLDVLYNKKTNHSIKPEKPFLDKKENSGIIKDSENKNFSEIHLSSIDRSAPFKKVGKVKKDSGFDEGTLKVLDVYRSLIFKNCNEETPAIIKNLSLAIGEFKKYYPEDYIAKCIEAITLFSKDKWCNDLKKDVSEITRLAPSRFLSLSFVQEKLLPLISTNQNTNGNLCTVPSITEDRIREAKKFNAENLRRWDERRTKSGTSGKGV